ncbi:MAG: PIN domain-containing protein [Candidatus Thermoplasmatota archaeon]
MRSYLFDTNAISLILSDALPEKWSRYWKEVKYGIKKVILFEGLVSEIFYKNAPEFGFRLMKKKLEWIKSLPKSDVVRITDEDAFQAGEYMVKLRNFGLSLIDAYILTLAQKNTAIIITSDIALKQASKIVGVECDYLPLRKES